MKLVGVCLTLALILIPAAALAVDVKVQHSDPVEGKTYKTYSWQPGTHTENDLMHQRIVAGVDYHLSMKGYLRVETDADFYVTYHASSEVATKIDTARFGYQRSDWYTRSNFSGATTSSYKRDYLQGTLILDLWDGGNKDVFWMGTATAAISEVPQKNEKLVNKALEKMFKQFPDAD